MMIQSIQRFQAPQNRSQNKQKTASFGQTAAPAQKLVQEAIVPRQPKKLLGLPDSNHEKNRARAAMLLLNLLERNALVPATAAAKKPHSVRLIPDDAEYEMRALALPSRATVQINDLHKKTPRIYVTKLGERTVQLDPTGTFFTDILTLADKRHPEAMAAAKK